jgi:hypothetical protein
MYYSQNKFINNVTFNSLATTLVPWPIPNVNVTVDNNALNIAGYYKISFIMPQNIPAGGAITITIPPQYGLPTT